ncbi:tRNA methyltransferase roswell [Lasioglossum baleicum]|uniref:tRNA methyltransferase roswell n=1 Tax=Lasioglossum baleicum TaxID=434251 RepID=UPI003FCC90B5
MFSNTFRGCVTISRKFNLNAFIYSIQDKTIDPVFTYTKQTHRFNYYALTIRNCSTHESKSVEVSRYYQEEDEKKLKQLLTDPKMMFLYEKMGLEIETTRQMNGRVPTTMSATDWLMLLAATSKSQRRHYLDHRWKIEKSEEAEKLEKQAKQAKLQKVVEERETEPTDITTYGLFHNTMFIRISRQAMNNFYNARLINSIMYEPKIVYDLGYDADMTAYEALNCSKQLLMSFALNRYHPEPFNLYFCNANKSSLVMRQFHKGVPTVYEDSYPLYITEKSYLDVFDRDKIVYLTPDAPTVLETFDPNMVYIIGAMVDKVNPQRVSFAKARKEKIKMVRLPLAEYLPWGSGSAKNLPLNQVLGILLELRRTRNWKKALEMHIPKRKLQSARIDKLTKQISERKQMLDMLMKET